MRILTAACVLLFCCATVAHSAVIHVPADWPTIQAGIDAAVGGDTVLVGPGTYSENLTFAAKDMVLRSEFGAATTILAPALTAYPIVTINGGQTPATELTGFTVTGAAGATSSNAIHVVSSSPRIHHNIFRNNADGCVLRVTGNAQPAISYNLFHDNPSCTWAVYCDGSGAIRYVNNTIVNSLRGLWIWSAGSIVENNIVTGCTWGMYTNAAQMTRTYNDIWGNIVNYHGTAPDPLDVSFDPLFENAANGDYHLSPDSPCMDAGDPDSQYLDPGGTRNDLGALPFAWLFPIPTAINLGLENGTHVVSHAPIIHWSYFDTSPSSQTAYQVEVGTDHDWVVAEMWASGEMASADNFSLYAGALLVDGTLYYLRVRLSSDSGWGEWRNFSFRLNSAPSDPNPLSPINQEAINTNWVICRVQNAVDAEADSLQYDFEMYADANLISLVFSQYGVRELQNSTATSPVLGLDSMANYWWRSRAYDGYEYSQWSSTASFSTRPPSRGPIIRVPTNEPTIQAGIDAAADGDTVLIADGTYTGYGNRDIDFLGKEIVVMSENGPATCIVDCAASSADRHRGFVFRNGATPASELRGLTIQNGAAPFDSISVWSLFGSIGGGVYCTRGASPTIRNCVFRRNSAYLFGGAIFTDSSELVLLDCKFDTNYSNYRGGAILLAAARDSVTITDCEFTGNSADNAGGAILCLFADKPLTLLRCQFESNSSADWAAALGCDFSFPTPSLYAESCRFAGNSACGNTIGWGGEARLVSCEILKNINCDGRYLTFEFGSLNATDCVIASNRLMSTNRSLNINDRAFPILDVEGLAALFNCTIVNNSSAQVGIKADSVSLTNCIFAANQVDTPIVSRALVASCSDVYGNIGDWVGDIASQFGVNGNISVDPLFCDTTIGNYYLQDASACGPESTGCGLMGALPVGCAGAVLSNLWLEGESPGHVISHMPTFAWARVVPFSQAAYEFQLSADSDWAISEMWSPGVIPATDTTVSYAGLPLEDGSGYFARVRVSDGSLWSSWAEIAFHMNAVPEAPELLIPADLTLVTTSTPTFLVRAGADPESDLQQVEFHIYVDDSLEVERSPLVPLSPVSGGDSVYWTADTILVENSSYLWLARAWDGFEWSSLWDHWRNFSVNALEEAPEAASASTPSGDSIMYTVHPVYHWSLSKDPDPLDVVIYGFRASVDSEFTFVFAVDGLEDTTYSDSTTLETARRYWWKVLSRDTHGLSAESAVETFRTYRPGDVDGSWSVSSADIIELVNFVFKGAALQVPECAAHINSDGMATAADIIYLVNYVFKSGPEPAVKCP